MFKQHSKNEKVAKTFLATIMVAVVLFTVACSDEGITTNATLPKIGSELQEMEFFHDLLSGNITSIEFITSAPHIEGVKGRPEMFWTLNLDEKLTAEQGSSIYAVEGKYTYDLSGDNNSPKARFRFIFERNPNEGIYIRTQTQDAPLNEKDWTSKKAFTIRNGDIYIWDYEIDYDKSSISIYTKSAVNEYLLKDTALESTNGGFGIRTPSELWFATGYGASRIIRDFKVTKKIE